MTDPQLERDAIALFEAMLDVAEDDRNAWIAAQTEGRPDLAARVRAMREAERIVGLQTGAAAAELEEETAPERIGAYRIVELIGRGGMGSVYRGDRATGDFAHAVAIKIIKPGLLSEALVDRFQRERQTLARLSHPNIAQLYDGGETDAGSPYIVMELVDGLPVLQFADEHGLSRAARRKLFCDICAAVAFAHRNLVVHRDLTPSNVLVTRDGTVKLIDFGIAKPADDIGHMGVAPSIGSLSLTPGYAAPERMMSAEVTTAADIYSLGKLLEKLIPPDAGDTDFRAIVARATALRPQDRYATADALGADVAAWGAGMPVVAVDGGRGYAVRKFVARHRIGVGATALGVLLLAAALAVALVAGYRELEARRDADQRFNQTRAIARTLLFDAYDELVRTPGSTRARAMLARTGLSYLDTLATLPDAPVDVQVDTANGYVRLAQVTGTMGSAGLARFEDANVLLDRAQAVARRLAARDPDAPGVRAMRAKLLTERAGADLYNNNDPVAARRQAREAQALLRPVATASRDNARVYAAAIQTEGDSHLWDEQSEKAREVHLRGEAFIAGLPSAMRQWREIWLVRAANLRLLGEAYHRLSDESAARRVLDQGLRSTRRWPRDGRTTRCCSGHCSSRCAIAQWFTAATSAARRHASRSTTR